MIATKEQERKALEQIRKIVERLGENSYIATAFEGCFEIAAQNIDNDWACSFANELATSEKKRAKAETENKELAERLDYSNQELEKAKAKSLTNKEAAQLMAIIRNANQEDDARRNSAAEAIVTLADNPDTPSFKKAVSEHRNAAERIESRMAIFEKLANM